VSLPLFSQIRPYLVTSAEKAAAPRQDTFVTIPYKPKPQYEFRIQISPCDCMGCEVCVNTCPKKALTMADTATRIAEDADNWVYCAEHLPDRGNEMADPTSTTYQPVAGPLQFRQPMLEFSAACAGCMETPIVKLLTQLYGERLYIANTCGCSMVWGGYLPVCGYTTNRAGWGPAYTGSLFEDDAELALGIAAGGQHRRSLLAVAAEKAIKAAESA